MEETYFEDQFLPDCGWCDPYLKTYGMCKAHREYYESFGGPVEEPPGRQLFSTQQLREITDVIRFGYIAIK